jgi:hypothetical protein
MLTAMMALWNMRGASHDVWAVNTDFDYHEEQKVGTASERGGRGATGEAADSADHERIAARAG